MQIDSRVEGNNELSVTLLDYSMENVQIINERYGEIFSTFLILSCCCCTDESFCFPFWLFDQEFVIILHVKEHARLTIFTLLANFHVINEKFHPMHT